MARAADPFQGEARSEGLMRGRGGFLRSGGVDGTPYVAHPTKTTKQDGNKADLLKMCAERGIEVPDKVTVPQLHDLLGPRPQRVPYGSPSGFGSLIEDPFALAKYTERYIVEGIGMDDMLQAQCRNLAAMGREHPQFTATADGIVAAARTTANHMLAADRGTHLHAVTDDVDLGRDWSRRIPDGEALGLSADVQAALVAAWLAMKEHHGIEMLAVEASCVDDEWRLAGTLDRIVRLGMPLRFALPGGEVAELAAGGVYLMDTKSGNPRRHKHAIQIASYAQSVPYDVEAETRGVWPWQINQRWALIAHLDVAGALDGDPACTLVLVDLEAGRAHGGACVLAAKAWGARSDLFSVANISDTNIAAAGESLPPALSAELSPLRQAQADRKRQNAMADAKRRLHGTPEEGTMSDDRTFLALQKRHERLDPAARSWIAKLGEQARDAQVPFGSRTTKSQRRFEILNGLVTLGECEGDSDAQARELLASVDPRIEQLGAVDLGRIVGSLSATEATHFARLAVALKDDALVFDPATKRYEVAA